MFSIYGYYSPYGGDMSSYNMMMEHIRTSIVAVKGQIIQHMQKVHARRGVSVCAFYVPLSEGRWHLASLSGRFGWSVSWRLEVSHPEGRAETANAR